MPRPTSMFETPQQKFATELCQRLPIVSKNSGTLTVLTVLQLVSKMKMN